METVALIFGGFFILIALVIAAALAMKFNGVKTINPQQNVAKQSTLRPSLPHNVVLPENFEKEIERLISSGQFIEAIKLCRDVTGGDLRSAKEMVDNIGNTRLSAPLQQIQQAAGQVGEVVDAARLEEIKHLFQSGRKIDAIKLYRETYRTGLKEAKEAVERMAR